MTNGFSNITRDDVSDDEMLQFIVGLAPAAIVEKVIRLARADVDFATELKALCDLTDARPPSIADSVENFEGDGHAAPSPVLHDVTTKLSDAELRINETFTSMKEQGFARYPGLSEPLSKEQAVYQTAEQLYRQNLDWVSFFRETLGVDGIVRAVYPEPEALAAFEQTHEYSAIQHMVAKLRERSGTLPPPQEAARVITIRLPQSLHESLRAEAHDMHTSMNKLCISKLLQFVDSELVPTDSAPVIEAQSEAAFDAS